MSSGKNKISAELVSHVAKLANLKFDVTALAGMTEQLSRIIGYVDQLNEISAAPLAKRWDTARPAVPESDDTVEASLPAEIALQQAPQKTGTAFQVPRIID